MLSAVDAALGLGGSASGDTDVIGASVAASGALSGGMLSNIFALATFIPSVSVGVRRLHDTDRSGWWILLPLLPIFIGAFMLGFGLAGALGGAGLGSAATIGLVLLGVGVIASIVLLVWLCTAGTAGPNRFGEDPKGVHTDAEQVFG